MNYKLKKIIIEDEKGVIQELEFEFEHMEYTMESGIKRTRKWGSYVTHIDQNGQNRVLIKAWSGCPTFESFQKES